MRGFLWVPSLSFLLPLPCLTLSSPLLSSLQSLTSLFYGEQSEKEKSPSESSPLDADNKDVVSSQLWQGQPGAALGFPGSLHHSRVVPRALAAGDTTQAAPSCPPAPPCQCHEHRAPCVLRLPSLHTSASLCWCLFFLSAASGIKQVLLETSRDRRILLFVSFFFSLSTKVQESVTVVAVEKK